MTDRPKPLAEVELMCDNHLNYFVRLWVPNGCIDIPVRSKNGGLELIARIVAENKDKVIT